MIYSTTKFKTAAIIGSLAAASSVALFRLARKFWPTPKTITIGECDKPTCWEVYAYMDEKTPVLVLRTSCYDLANEATSAVIYTTKCRHVLCYPLKSSSPVRDFVNEDDRIKKLLNQSERLKKCYFKVADKARA